MAWTNSSVRQSPRPFAVADAEAALVQAKANPLAISAAFTASAGKWRSRAVIK
jgi:hypothetical protein